MCPAKRGSLTGEVVEATTIAGAHRERVSGSVRQHRSGWRPGRLVASCREIAESFTISSDHREWVSGPVRQHRAGWRPCRLGVLMLMFWPISSHAEDSVAVKALWANPPRQYSTAPLWVWNDMLTEQQVVGTLRDLAAQHVKQAFVHPRPGLMTPYLSDDWFRLWKVALDEAQRLDMDLWIYDENSYPSGFAGGFVPEVMPESRGRVLQSREAKQPAATEDLLAVFRLDETEYEDVTAAVRAAQALPAARYLVFQVVHSKPSPWYGNRSYVDLLRPGVTEKFLEITLEPYRKRFGQEFGRRIPGSFTDEPRLEGGGLHWTEDLPQQFEKRWGYALLPQLPCLVRPVGDWRRVRHNFLTVLHELFVQRWAKPYFAYCQQHKLEFTGHYWEHEWPRCNNVPDNMAMYAWHQRPAIDCLMNEYKEDVNAQFGNVRFVKELASVANQLGRKRTLCEAYGAGGWDLRFEDMKRIGDWLCVLGVNTIDEHLSFITLRGARKHDHPQSFSYHEPWWPDYHVMARYLTRLSLAMSAGKQVNRILVLEPTSTAWMYWRAADPEGKEHLKALGDSFFDLLMSLERAQVEYDLGCEDILTHHGSVQGNRLRVGQRDYDVVVLPPMTETLNSRTMQLLEAYLAAGGKVLAVGEGPTLVDAQLSPRPLHAANHSNWTRVPVDQAPMALAASASDGFAICRQSHDNGILFHQRRHLNDGQLVLLVNTSLEAPSRGKILHSAAAVEAWDLQSGTILAYPAARSAVGVRVAYDLPPGGSLLLFFGREQRDLSAQESASSVCVPPAAPIEVARVEPNVLTLDYVDVLVGGETRKDCYFYKAAELVFQKHGLAANPWDHAVQFGEELIRQKFPADSGFEATYRFTIEQAVPNQLWIVIERPDLYTITCNGRSVASEKDAWWLDRAFGKIDLRTAAQVGENSVTLKASPFSLYHELERAYVLGDFTLRPVARGFVIVPGGQLRVAAEGWSKQGHPFYAHSVAYRAQFNISAPAGRYEVSLPSWLGSVARVAVNGQQVGHIFHQPWRCDVTSAIRPGSNAIEVTVLGTLKNTLGPHHGNPGLGRAWPAAFRQGPAVGPPAGDTYHTVEYGLFAPYELLHTTR